MKRGHFWAWAAALSVVSCAIDDRVPSTSSDLDASSEVRFEQPSQSGATSNDPDASALPPPLVGSDPTDPKGAVAAACTEPAGCDPATRACAPICPCQPGSASTCYWVHGSKGVCAPRALTCTAAGAWPPLSECGPRSAELCLPDGLDEDCDGAFNENCACSAGDVSSCGVVYGSLGVCADRSLTCSPAGTWPNNGECAPTTAELCDASFLDENCDGRANEAPPCDRFIALSSGGRHNCALSESKTVSCWGSNDSGQLGDGTTLDRLTPGRIAGLTGVTSVAVGGSHGCASLQDGTVVCWGDNSGQQLADGTQIDHLTPAPVPGLSNIRFVTAGGGRSCALDQDGSVQCWGGHNPGASTGNGGSPIPVDLPLPMSQMFTGAGATCAVGIDFRVYCWGTGLSMTPPPLGDGLNVPSEQPVLVGAIQTASLVTLAQANACAIEFGGAIDCWGDNQYGQLGDGTTTYAPAPVRVTGGIQASQICSGGLHSCAVLADGSARCWGDNGEGQLGDGTLGASLTPVVVSDLGRINAISCGFNYTCALLADGTTHCWGGNDVGQLGNGTATAFSAVPVQVRGP